MTRSRLNAFLLAGLAGLVSGLPAATLADDTEVYIGSTELAITRGVQPNVLLILDTSGSMMTLVPGTGKSRLDNMKEALNGIVSNASNVNVGLMRFTNPGGAVIFPVAPIDSDSDAVYSAGGPVKDLTVRIADGNDDVEELRATARMDLTGAALELPWTNAFGNLNTTTARISEPGDDLEEDPGQAVEADNRVLTLGGAPGRDDGDDDDDDDDDDPGARGSPLVGLFFRSIPIPRGAYVTEAEITFHASQASSRDATLAFQAWRDGDAPGFGTGRGAVSSRPRTAATVTVHAPAWELERPYTASGLAPVIQEVVDLGDWDTNHGLGLIVTGVGERRAKSRDQTDIDQAALRITYADGPGGDQVLGLRFAGVPIPQGATIKSARLELAPTATRGDTVALKISAENVGDAAPFDRVGEKVSTKLGKATAAWVSWNVDSEWTAISTGGPVVSSPDLTTILQEVVNRPDWCGGNAIALLVEKLSGSGWRAVSSYEGNPTYAPALRVSYAYEAETAPAGSGCQQASARSQVRTGLDDGEQATPSGGMNLTDGVLDLVSGAVVGLRFQNVKVPRGAEILDARIELSASGNAAGAAGWRIHGEAADSALELAATDANLTRRPLTTAAVDWSAVPDWTAGQRYATPNLKGIVQEIVERAGWNSGNAMTFLISDVMGTRAASSHDGSPALAPTLEVTFRGTGPLTTVRQKLRETVDGLTHEGWTPIVDTLYEAARYYRGEGVLYGRDRGADEDAQLNTRLSHPASYTGGTVVRPFGCTEDNLSAPACRGERIEGNPVYISPIKENCGTNYVILLTDGEANNNHSVASIQDLTGGTCQATLSDGSPLTEGEVCGLELARFLSSQDQSSAVPGEQKVLLYTVGFNLDPGNEAQAHAIRFLHEMAEKTGGWYRSASTSADLADAFEAFFLDVQGRPTSYASPALSLNAFNPLFHRDEVYFALFSPSARSAWKGNLKKYRICTTPETCTLGEVLDATGKSALDADGRIRDTAQSYWSPAPDGADVVRGGAGNAGPGYGSRRVLTFTGGTPPAGEPFVDLSLDAHQVTPANEALTAVMLGLAGPATEAERQALVEWVRGKDVDDEDADTVTEESRYSFGDPLHSRPVVVSYGGDEAGPVDKVFVGTNDGALRMIDGATGVEEWAFYPPETLANQAALRRNANGPHIYGMDGTPTVWVRDQDRDGTVGDTDGDFVRLLAGMRRGGNRIYALDVTPATPLTAPGQIGPTYPKLMWRIDGASLEYPRLGQTWSRPLVTKVRVGTGTEGTSAVEEVVLFGGGYDPTQDTAFGPSATGNALYMANAATGRRKLWISGASHSGGTGVLAPEMRFPIPSDLSLLDTDGDGATDRIYVGDLGGQIWRVDLFPEPGTEGGVRAVVGKLASVSDLTPSADPADQRRFFYPPDVVQVVDRRYSAIARYDLVVIASGDREHPLSTAVTDRAFAIRDYHTAPLSDGPSGDPGDGSPDGHADGYRAVLGPPASATDLFDATRTLSFEGQTGTADLTALRQSRGWYLTLEAPGEKGLAPVVTLGGKLFFTSYVPSGVIISEGCRIEEGEGRLYGLNVLNGLPNFNWHAVEGRDDLTGAERSYSLGAGVPSGVAPVFTEGGIRLLIGVGGGAITRDPELALPRQQTYWMQSP